MRKTLTVLILAVALMLVVSACNSDDDVSLARADFGGDAASATTMAASVDEERSGLAESDGTAANQTEAPEALDDGAAKTNAQAVLTSLDLVDLGRSIIFTANIHIEVEDVIAAGAEIENALVGLGAVLFGQETTTGDNPRSILTIKVRPDRFDDALDRLAGVGELVSQ